MFVVEKNIAFEKKLFTKRFKNKDRFISYGNFEDFCKYASHFLSIAFMLNYIGL